MNTSIERHARVSHRLAGNRSRGHVGDPAHVLVGAARIVGEPFDLYRAAGRRRRLSVRLPDQPDSAAAAACVNWRRCDPAQQRSRSRQPYSLRRDAAHGDRFHRRVSSTVSTRCTANVAIAASCSGSRCRFRISRQCSRRRAFRSWFCRCSSSRSPLPLQCIMLLLSSAVLLVSGLGAATLWTQLPLFQMDWCCCTALTVLALWHAPIYGWLLLVSGWARRAPFLWAVLPPLAIGVFEKIAFHTSYFGSMLRVALGADSRRRLSISRTSMASRSIRILFRWRNSLRGDS